MYPGGKGSHYQKIINLIPPHSVYIETHLGSGAIMRHKRPAALSIGLDVNYGVLHETAGNIVKTSDTAVSPHSTMGAPIVECGDNYRRPSLKTAMLADIATNDDMVQHMFICQDAATFLGSYPFTGNEFVYCDPPYLMETRRSQRSLYEFEYSEQDHLNLLAVLKTITCPVAISGYWSEMYADTLGLWHTYTYEARTRGGSMATEWLWMNYAPPTVLHDYSHLGNSFRERERIKRKKARWVNRLQKTEGLERQAILWAIQEAGLLPEASP